MFLFCFTLFSLRNVANFHRYHTKLTIDQFQPILHLFRNIIIIYGVPFLDVTIFTLGFSWFYGRDGARTHNLLIGSPMLLMALIVKHYFAGDLDWSDH